MSSEHLKVSEKYRDISLKFAEASAKVKETSKKLQEALRKLQEATNKIEVLTIYANASNNLHHASVNYEEASANHSEASTNHQHLFSELGIAFRELQADSGQLSALESEIPLENDAQCKGITSVKMMSLQHSGQLEVLDDPDKLRSNIVFLAKRTTNWAELRIELCGCGLLSVAEVEELQNKHNDDSSRFFAMYTTVGRRPKFLEKLIKCLEDSNNGDVAKMISTEPSGTSSSSPIWRKELMEINSTVKQIVLNLSGLQSKLTNGQQCKSDIATQRNSIMTQLETISQKIDATNANLQQSASTVVIIELTEIITNLKVQKLELVKKLKEYDHELEQKNLELEALKAEIESTERKKLNLEKEKQNLEERIQVNLAAFTKDKEVLEELILKEKENSEILKQHLETSNSESAKKDTEWETKLQNSEIAMFHLNIQIEKLKQDISYLTLNKDESLVQDTTEIVDYVDSSSLASMPDSSKPNEGENIKNQENVFEKYLPNEIITFTATPSQFKTFVAPSLLIFPSNAKKFRIEFHNIDPTLLMAFLSNFTKLECVELINCRLLSKFSEVLKFPNLRKVVIEVISKQEETHTLLDNTYLYFATHYEDIINTYISLSINFELIVNGRRLFKIDFGNGELIVSDGLKITTELETVVRFRLQKLSLSSFRSGGGGNPFESIKLQSLSNLTKLYLWGVEIKTENLQSCFQKLTSLQSLYIIIPLSITISINIKEIPRDLKCLVTRGLLLEYSPKVCFRNLKKLSFDTIDDRFGNTLENQMTKIFPNVKKVALLSQPKNEQIVPLLLLHISKIDTVKWIWLYSLDYNPHLRRVILTANTLGSRNDRSTFKLNQENELKTASSCVLIKKEVLDLTFYEAGVANLHEEIRRLNFDFHRFSKFFKTMEDFYVD